MVHLVNQIALFFQSYPQDEAVAGVADHIKRFWPVRMRQQLFDYVADGGAGPATPSSPRGAHANPEDRIAHPGQRPVRRSVGLVPSD